MQDIEPRHAEQVEMLKKWLCDMTLLKCVDEVENREWEGDAREAQLPFTVSDFCATL